MKNKNKNWLCGLTYGPAIEAVKKNIIPIAKHFDGLNIVLHKSGTILTPEEQELFNILNENRGDGKIHLFDWIKRYDFSRNRYLFDPLMKSGDFFVVLDSLEQLTDDFCAKDLPKLQQAMVDNNIEMMFHGGKRFIVRKNEWMRYENGTHECIRPVSRVAELTEIEGYEDSSKYFTNTRPLVRDTLHFINHYMKYYLIDGTMQCLLGTEGDKDLTNERWQNRHNFRQYLDNQGVDLDCDSILEFFKKGLTEELKEFLNKEKILNDFYRQNVLGETDIVDNHDYKDIKEV